MLNDILTIGQVLTAAGLVALGTVAAVKQYDAYSKKISEWAKAVKAGMTIDSVPVRYRKAVLKAMAKNSSR